MTAPAPRFAGKSVVVTGAAGVFGRWIAGAFAREGAKVCLSDNRGDKLEAVARDIGLNPTRTLTHATELTSEASIVDLAATGSAVVVISQDLDELLGLCDTLAVINGGRLSKSMKVSEADIDEIGLLMGGIHGETEAAHAA